MNRFFLLLALCALAALPAAAAPRVSAPARRLLASARADEDAARYAQAVARLRAAPATLAPADAGAVRLLTADIQYLWAVSLELEKSPLALSHFQAALAIDRTLRPAQAGADLNRIGTLLFGAGRYAEAAAAHRQALPLLPRTGGRDEKDEVAACLCNLGNADVRLGRPAEALVLYRQALPLFQQLDEQDDVALVILDTGNAYYGLKRFREALLSYRKALPLFQRVGDEPHRALATANIALVRGRLAGPQAGPR